MYIRTHIGDYLLADDRRCMLWLEFINQGGGYLGSLPAPGLGGIWCGGGWGAYGGGGWGAVGGRGFGPMQGRRGEEVGAANGTCVRTDPDQDCTRGQFLLARRPEAASIPEHSWHHRYVYPDMDVLQSADHVLVLRPPRRQRTMPSAVRPILDCCSTPFPSFVASCMSASEKAAGRQGDGVWIEWMWDMQQSPETQICLLATPGVSPQKLSMANRAGQEASKQKAYELREPCHTWPTLLHHGGLMRFPRNEHPLARMHAGMIIPHVSKA